MKTRCEILDNVLGESPGVYVYPITSTETTWLEESSGGRTRRSTLLTLIHGGKAIWWECHWSVRIREPGLGSEIAPINLPVTRLETTRFKS